MINREQVLHVAKLARLRLTDDEVERMSSELSGILEHVERMNKLDIEGVEPTSDTRRMRLASVQVKGVPDVSVEEALWTVAETVLGAPE